MGGLKGEKLMSSDLKFSLFTTVVVLALIVAAGLTAALHWIYAPSPSRSPPFSTLSLELTTPL